MGINFVWTLSQRWSCRSELAVRVGGVRHKLTDDGFEFLPIGTRRSRAQIQFSYQHVLDFPQTGLNQTHTQTAACVPLKYIKILLGGGRIKCFVIFLVPVEREPRLLC